MHSITNRLLFFTGLTLVVYVVAAAMIDVMDIDSSHYAEMAREMSSSGSFLILKNRTVDDYLDKPPLIFWLASIAYIVFGVSGFVFRIPVILASILGAYSAYRFTKLYYNKESGILAAAMLLSSQIYFLYNHNFLTDSLLANFTMFSIWQLSEYVERKKGVFFFGAFIGMAFAMMSKGPLGLMVPLLAFSVHFIYKKRWNMFLRWQWLAGLLVTLVILVPMMVGLYRQFGTIGLQFFYWTQSFGRITGQSHWHDTSSPFFFVHTFLWFFLPWSLLALYATGRKLSRIFKRAGAGKALPEAITTGGFVLSFLVLSASQYKQPQYIFVLMPLVAIITATTAMDMIRALNKNRARNLFTRLHFIIACIYLIGVVMIMIFVFPGAGFFKWLLVSLSVALFIFFISDRRHQPYRLILPVLSTVILVNLLLDIHFYPRLMKYQSGHEIARDVKQRGIAVADDLFLFRYHSPALDFYLEYPAPVINSRKLERLADSHPDLWIITDEQGFKYVDKRLVSEEIIFDQYPVQALSLDFMLASKRKEVLRKTYLLKIARPSPG